MKRNFNVRVYGLLINDKNEILISDEEENGLQFSKFPGGGLENGEGLLEGLKREFAEECSTDIEITDHFYTTDFYVKSVFDDSQVIAVYYRIKTDGDFSCKISKIPFDFEEQCSNSKQSFRMVSINELDSNSVTFPADQHVVSLIKAAYL